MRRTLLLASLLISSVACDAPDVVRLAGAPAATAVRFDNTRYVTPTPTAAKKAKRVKTPVAKKKVAPAKPSVWDDVDWETEAEAEDDYLPWELSEASFNAIVDDWTGVRNCVRAARATSGGALRMKFDIGNNGSVKSARTLDTSNALASVVAPCVERKARTLKFPPFEQDGGVQRVAKFVF